jgi:hypothetical protein
MFKNPCQKIARASLLGLVIVAGGISAAHAASVTVVNYSFEDPKLNNPGDYNSTITGWDRNTSAVAASVEYYNGGHFTANNPLVAPADGFQGVSINTNDGGSGIRGMIYQNVGLLLPQTTYTLTVAMGARLDFGGASGSFAMYNGNDLTGALLVSSAVFAPAAGTFQEYSVTFTTGATVSGNLVVALIHNDAGQVSFDNVRLDATSVIPEASSSALIASGLCLLAVRRKRR